MRIARVLFIAALLLSGFTNTARAAGQAPDRAVGFIKLVTNAQANVPIETQTQNALRRLLPTLRAAQKRGQVVEFEGSPSSGVLKLVYRPSAGALNIAGKTIYTHIKDAMAPESALREAGGLAQMSASAGTGFFDMHLYEDFFQATGLAAGAHVIGSLRNAGGAVLAVYEGTADGTGELFDFFPLNGPFSNVLPGYRVTFKEYNGSTLLNTYMTIVPNLAFSSMDKPNAILRGTGPAGKQVQGQWSRELWNAANSVAQRNAVSTVSGAGTWAVDFGTIPIRGGDSFDVLVLQNANFSFGRHMYAPYMYCQTGGDFCELSGLPSTAAAIQIVHGGITRNFTGKFSAFGFFDADPQNADGSPIFIAAGDKVSGTGIVPYLLPNLTTALNYTTDVMSGQAPANRFMDAWVWVAATQTWYEVYTQANSGGVYSADFSGFADLISGEPYMTEVFFVLPITGNTTDYYRGIGP